MDEHSVFFDGIGNCGEFIKVVSKGIEEYKSLVQGELQMADCGEQVIYGSIALAGCILAVWQVEERNRSKGVLERIIGVLKGRYDKVS